MTGELLCDLFDGSLEWGILVDLIANFVTLKCAYPISSKFNPHDPSRPCTIHKIFLDI